MSIPLPHPRGLRNGQIAGWLLEQADHSRKTINEETMRDRTPGSVAALRQKGTYLQEAQWGTTPIKGPTCTEEEKAELKKTGFYSVQWKKLRSKK